MAKEHRDYFGNLIEPGDKILRTINSQLVPTTVIKLTPNYIYVERSGWSKKYYGDRPIAIHLRYRDASELIINLTKLNLT